MSVELRFSRRMFLGASGGAGVAFVFEAGVVRARDSDGMYQDGGYIEELEIVEAQVNTHVSLEPEVETEEQIAQLPEEGVVFEAEKQDPKDNVRALIRETAKEEGINQNDFERVAECESKLEPNAYNPSGASGVFQFIPKTWNYVMEKLGYPGWDVMNPEHNVKAAAWLWKKEGKGHWWCK